LVTTSSTAGSATRSRTRRTESWRHFAGYRSSASAREWTRQRARGFVSLLGLIRSGGIGDLPGANDGGGRAGDRQRGPVSANLRTAHGHRQYLGGVGQLFGVGGSRGGASERRGTAPSRLYRQL